MSKKETKTINNDYTKSSLYFQIKKTLRYIRIFGLFKTYIIVKSQYHMKSQVDFIGERWINPDCKFPNADNKIVAIIGCGKFAFSNIAYYLKKYNKNFLRCAYSSGRKNAVSLCKAYNGAYVPSDWHEILTDKQVKIVYIASNHSSHAEYAIACIEAGKNVYIEKPHVVSKDQLELLINSMKRNPKVKVFLGFSRSKSQLFKKLQELVRDETGPLMINWFIASHEISDTENNSLNEKDNCPVLGHLCHWTDLTLSLVGLDKAFPCIIIPARPSKTKSDFAVSIIFSDQSCASFTFSAKGHVFEGLQEILNLHKGNLLANLTNFNFLKINLFDKKKIIRLYHRDHGHKSHIIYSLIATIDDKINGESQQYISATAQLFLSTSEAVNSGKVIKLSYDEKISKFVSNDEPCYNRN